MLETYHVARSKFGGSRPVGVARLGDVEPPRLPPFHGLREGAVKPGDVRHLAHHGPSALRLLAAHDLRLHAEDLRPQAKMSLDAEEGLHTTMNAEMLRTKFGARSWKSSP